MCTRWISFTLRLNNWRVIEYNTVSIVLHMYLITISIHRLPLFHTTLILFIVHRLSSSFSSSCFYILVWHFQSVLFGLFVECICVCVCVRIMQCAVCNLLRVTAYTMKCLSVRTVQWTTIKLVSTSTSYKSINHHTRRGIYLCLASGIRHSLPTYCMKYYLLECFFVSAVVYCDLMFRRFHFELMKKHWVSLISISHRHIVRPLYLSYLLRSKTFIRFMIDLFICIPDVFGMVVVEVSAEWKQLWWNERARTSI